MLSDSSATKRRNLLFTSAGDRANLERWVERERSFDLWIVYYGDKSGRYKDIADRYCARKGSKFQNLKFAYDTWPEDFASYEAVMVMDDDVLIDAKRIERLFETRREQDLWVLQPAFDPLGKVSWAITRVNPLCRLRFTNFVEMTCPLFRQDKLAQFMAVYDPVLVGFGMDWWFLHSMGPGLERRIAVVDEIVCTNPHDRTKGRVREIDRLQSTVERRRVWEDVKRKHGIRAEEQGFVEFARIPRPWRAALWPLLKYALVMALARARWIAWFLRERIRGRLQRLRVAD